MELGLSREPERLGWAGLPEEAEEASSSPRGTKSDCSVLSPIGPGQDRLPETPQTLEKGRAVQGGGGLGSWVPGKGPLVFGRRLMATLAEAGKKITGQIPN